MLDVTDIDNLYACVGAIRIALGAAATGVFSNSTAVFQKLQKAGALSGDRVWRMPLWQHYTKRMTGTYQHF
jgi:aminopeptidase